MRRLTLVPAIVMCLASPAIAEGQAGKLYLQLDGGAVCPAENEAAGLDIEYDIGFAVGGRIGYRTTDNVRVEADISYFSAEIGEVDGIDVDDLGLELDVSVISAEVGAYVDFLQVDPISPYVGGGIEVAY